MPVHVEVDAFSGRPNPGWNLSDHEAAQLVERLAKLVETVPQDRSIPQGLGFRGLKISGLPGYDSLVVYRDVVESSQMNRRHQWTDSSRSLEQFLLQTARGHLDPSLYKLVTSITTG